MKYRVPLELETERLFLRQFQEEDWLGLHKYYSDAEATRYTVGKAFTEGETWRIMCSMIGHWQVRGYGPYAVLEKSTGQILGPVGFWYPNDWPAPEVKWALASEYWGQGFASEAARKVQSIGRAYLPEISLISFIHSDNQPSLKLAERLGAVLEKEVLFRGGIWKIYRHPKE
ncbi:GNAT family N-acetyltransferase [Endozoicomonas elysicola]|uniref:Acetyltransferase n=1 Tax=Endozoicomonas elysicola TaxID=305900 RepID=A0A081K8J0_9GAMM|nr:GNAT family N-acetyltransferase [Endozoicomonas elysicola]KEI70466.1 acetyltransferase [Endozoicomonas elysicola]